MKATKSTAARHPSGGSDAWQAHELLQALLQASPLAIAVADVEGCIEIWNPAAERIFGWTEAEVAAGSAPFMANAGEIPRIRERVLKGEMFTGLEVRRSRKDGSQIDLSLSAAPIRDPAGRVAGILAIYTDLTDRKRLEQSVHDSASRRAAVFEAALDGIITIDHEGRIIEFNPAAEKMFGYTRARAMGKALADLIVVPALGEGHRRDVAQHLATGAGAILGKQIELTAARADGTEFPIELISIRTSDAGRPVLTGFIRDITDRNRAEEVLRRNEQRFRAIIEHVFDGFYLVDAEGVIEYVSPSMPRITGYAAEEVLGRSLFVLVHPDDVYRARAFLVGVIEKPRNYASTDVRARHKDGSWRWLEGVVTNLLDEPDVRAISVNFRDVTDRKQAEETRSRLASIVESSADAIISVTLDGIIQTWNAGAEAMYGYPAQEAVGRPVSFLVRPGETAEFYNQRDRLHRGERVHGVEVVRIRKDGSRIDVALSLAPVWDAAGRIVGVSTVSRDITERKRAEGEIRRRAAHLEALNTIIGTAAAATDLTQLLGVTLERALETLGCGIGSIWVGDVHITRGISPAVGRSIADTVGEAGSPLAGPITVSDWTQTPGVLAPLMARVGIRASLSVPIQTEGRYVGGLAIASAQPRPWQPDEVTLVEAVGKQLGAAAERLQLFRDTQLHAHLMEKLVTLTEGLNRPLAVSEAVVAIGQGALRLSGADRVAIYVRQADGLITCPWSLGLSSEHIAEVLARQADLAIGRLMTATTPERLTIAGGRVVEARKPFLVPDIQALPTDALVRPLAEREGYRAVGNWPLTYEGQVIAIVSCYYDAPRTWTRPEQEVFQSFCWQAAVALQNAGLREGQMQRATELESLSDLSKRLRAARTPEEMYPILVDQAMTLLQADHGSLSLLDTDRRILTRVRTVGIPSETAGSTLPVAGSRSGKVVQTGQPVVLADYSREAMPAWLDASAYRTVGPLAIVPVRSEQEIVGTLGLARKQSPGARPFTEAEVRLLQAIAEMGGTAIRRARLFHNLEQSYIQMVLALARTVDARDTYTSGHSERIAVWAEVMARELRCNAEEIQEIRWAALLHDIGKVGVPDEILRKPGPLTEAEQVVMRQHPVIGEEILVSTDRMHGVAKIVRHHQERWDGSGYPDGLRGEAIPLGARILAVVDAYSAITDDRPYKPARPPEEAIVELKRCAGSQFDPRIVTVFCQVIPVSGAKTQ